MAVIGLDLSLTSTGIALPKETKAIRPKTKGVVRLIYIRNEIMSELELVKNPLVIIEGYSFAQRNSQAHSLGELGGVIRVALAEADIPYTLVAPTQRAKFATGKGNAGKSEVVSAISARTGIVWSGVGADDKADAWILQEIGLTYLGRPRYDWPKVNQEVLDKIEWTVQP
jgi:crossover junction endodeoxyribonuclease RuvC